MINNEDSKCGGFDFDIPLVGGKAARRRKAASLCLILVERGRAETAREGRSTVISWSIHGLVLI